MNDTSKGNVLFLILIAVALFAALAYAVTQTGRGGGSAEREQAAINAARIIEYAGSIRSAVERMQLINNTSDAAISFDSPDWGFTDYQHGVPQPAVNQVFQANGGNINFVTLDDLGQIKFSGDNAIVGLGACDDNSSAACKELVLLIYGISDAICTEINRNTLGNPTIPSDSLEIGEASASTNVFNGTYGADTTVNSEIGSVALTAGQPSGCVVDTPGSGQNAFFHALIER